ncbi:MAG: SNF7 family protein [Candidatus Odinarchaeum yellowstonii]|uniref:SNF7 family protein n=1 Tax=Odinarchaeota yellowstonii (strain LCB_4) TaxID=1841599 RepID=A0AAF0IB10_ODILC|nr:MAG: SNF7 family protein [Candidatus Odinarchaeum yellowstonii]
MSFIRKLFPSRKKSSDETIAKLRANINKFTLISRQYYNRAAECRAEAKEFLKHGDVEAARSQIKRLGKYYNYYKRYQGQVDILEATIESINTAKDTVEMSKALEEANRLLAESVKTLTIDKAIETRMETEELINEIEAKQEELSRGFESTDSEESFVDKELEKLQNEIAVETLVSLPEAPSETPEELSERDRLREEVKKLKKKLSEGESEEKE